MALLWIDGFEKYGTANTTVSPTTIVEWKYLSDYDDRIDVWEGSTGNCIRLDSSSTSMQTPHLTGNRTLIMGMAFKLRDVDDGVQLFDFRTPDSDGETVGYQQLSTTVVSVNSANEIRVTQGTTTLNTSNGVDIQPDTWYYIEQKVYCDATLGTVEVRLDESSVISFSGNTQHRVSYNCYSSILWRTIQSDILYIDDLYICDGSGSKNNDIIGTCNVQTLSPTSDVTANWVADTGTDRYARINEMTQDAGYIKNATTGNQCTFEFDDLTVNGTPKGIMICADSQLNSKVNKYAKLITSNGTGSLVDSGYVIPGTDNPLTSSTIMENDSDGNAWTSATINSLRAGVEVV